MFYAIGVSSEGKSFVLDSQYLEREVAKHDIIGQANECSLYVDTDKIFVAKGTGKQDSTMTKNAKKRKKLRGKGART